MPQMISFASCVHHEKNIQTEKVFAGAMMILFTMYGQSMVLSW